jgi:hypothetical protein
VSSEQRLTLTNMVLVAILGASVDKSHSTKSSNKSRGLRRLNTSPRCRLETYSFLRISYRAKIESRKNDAP